MMKSRSTGLSAFALVVLSGCGVFAGKDLEPPPELEPVSVPDDSEPAAPPLEGTPSASELDESLGVFVVANARGRGDGTRAHPLATLAEGIEAAKASGKRVYACSGTYREAIAIADGVSMVGGLDCSSATWAIGNGRSRIESPVSPAITATGITSTTRVERFDVVAPDASELGGSSIGLFARNAGALTIAKSRIAAGRGGNGADGAAAVQLAQVGDPDGKPGTPERDFCAGKLNCFVNFAPNAGGTGGVSVCAGEAGHAVERGGNGGTSGIYESADPDAQHFMAYWRPYLADPSYAAKFGETRAMGPVASGANGASAQLPGTITEEGFLPANGARGTNGAAGHAGYGGRGAGPVSSANNKDLWYGNSGSGGGAGGCPGLAGGEGQGGGASIAAMVIDGAMAFDDVELASDNGGAGGKGSFGSDPTPGGKGGPMINGIALTAGANGSAGGSSGVSGSGAGGSSFALAHIGPAPQMRATTMRAGLPGAGVPALTSGAKTIPASVAGESGEIYAVAP